MVILKFYTFIYYQFIRYYEKWQAIVVFTGMILINVLSIFIIIISSLGLSIDDLIITRIKHEYFYDKFIIGGGWALTTFLFIYTIYLINKSKIKSFIEGFRNEDMKKLKRKRRYMYLYIVFTLCFLVFSFVYVGLISHL